MIIAAVIAALAIIFGAPQNDLLILKIKKPVKQIVIDQDRKEAILGEIKWIKKLQKAYGKKTKVFTKQLKQLGIDQKTDRETFDAFSKRHAELGSLATEAEWKSLSRELKKIV